MGSDLDLQHLAADMQVSIRAPAWGATSNPPDTIRNPMFQFALPHGERPTRIRNFHSATDVSIRAPAWGATLLVWPRRVVAAVSIRAPAWGATFLKEEIAQPFKVSIRAPAWGATRLLVLVGQFSIISIRAPAWGATAPGDFGLQTGRVSIRAPAWGATIYGQTARFAARCFNSRSRMGSDASEGKFQCFHGVFQFALPHGERLLYAWGSPATAKFQFALPHGERRS